MRKVESQNHRIEELNRRTEVLVTSGDSLGVYYKFKTKVNMYIALLLLVTIGSQMFTIFLVCEETALNHEIMRPTYQKLT